MAYVISGITLKKALRERAYEGFGGVTQYKERQKGCTSKHIDDSDSLFKRWVRLKF